MALSHTFTHKRARVTHARVFAVPVVRRIVHSIRPDQLYYDFVVRYKHVSVHWYVCVHNTRTWYAMSKIGKCPLSFISLLIARH